MPFPCLKAFSSSLVLIAFQGVLLWLIFKAHKFSKFSSHYYSTYIQCSQPTTLWYSQSVPLCKLFHCWECHLPLDLHPGTLTLLMCDFLPSIFLVLPDQYWLLCWYHTVFCTFIFPYSNVQLGYCQFDSPPWKFLEAGNIFKSILFSFIYNTVCNLQMVVNQHIFVMLKYNEKKIEWTSKTEAVFARPKMRSLLENKHATET